MNLGLCGICDKRENVYLDHLMELSDSELLILESH